MDTEKTSTEAGDGSHPGPSPADHRAGDTTNPGPAPEEHEADGAAGTGGP
ncbi:hypothetical protein [Haladaptatus sp. DYSN1]|nr:hypothetical protein [Haladaptatus sp. DYSN1]